MRVRQVAAVAIAATLAGGAATGAIAITPVTPKTITSSGVGDVKLGKTYTSLRKHGLVGKIRHGCPLGGTRTRSARLRAPLKGGVDFSLTSPRKVTAIDVTDGGAARGVGIDATTAEIKSAFPKAKVDHSTDDTFGLTLVKIPSNGGGRLVFGVDTKTKKVTSIGIPAIPFCE